jgi:L-alanine-DL-glutamate epimerase-like enolase superfamily enzyme
MHRSLEFSIDSFPLAEAFVISRGAKTSAVTVTATVTCNGSSGRGECVPYARYGETPESVCSAMETVRGPVESGCSRQDLLTLMPPGAARNALDCALWDLDAKVLGVSAIEMAGLHRLAPTVTAYTISAGTPESMAAAAAAHAAKPILKLKLAGDGDDERLAAVRASAPDSELIADANESWREDQLERLLAACAKAGVALVEQPLPAGADEALARIERIVPICADESAHVAGDLEALTNRYDAVNIKLDKAGGLTAALAMARRAQSLDLAIMTGSMVGTSLSMAPAMLLAPFSQWVDLDGPLLLARDRVPGLRHDGCVLYPPDRELWG